jgi:hypothetical protein
MTRRQQALRLFMLAALAILAGAWLLFPPAPKPPVPSQPASAAPVADQAPAAPFAQPAAAEVNPPPLPPRDASMQDALPALLARADAGDGIAACRLSTELTRCRTLQETLHRQVENLEGQATRPGRQSKPDALARSEAIIEWLRAESASCSALPDGLANRELHYLRAAALAGEPGSRLRYASGEGFFGRGYGYLRTPEFDHWRREAEAMMQQSLADGSAEAALSLAFAYAGEDGLFPSLVADDASRALAHVRLTQLLFGESISAFPLPLPQPRVPDAEASRAEALAVDWHQRHFGGRQIDLKALMQEFETRSLNDSPMADTGDDPCPGPGARDHG